MKLKGRVPVLTGRLTMASPPPCIVLVTGGSGFLGQHLIGLLQTHAEHVTEIRVLDITRYRNKLDYEPRKSLRQFIGSIDNKELLRTACEGVACVMHIAGVVDVSMFPNNERLRRINVQATSTLLEACKEAGVQRLIYCSSVSVAVGYNGVHNGTESGALPPEKFLFNGYASSKLAAERVVLSLNSDTFKTVALRPVAMYGEEDPQYVTQPLKVAKKTGFWPVINCSDATHQSAYVGNVAWSFICADKALINESVDHLLDGRKDTVHGKTRRTDKRHEFSNGKDSGHDDTTSEDDDNEHATDDESVHDITVKENHDSNIVNGGNRKNVKIVGGNAFNIADYTPMANMFEMKSPIAVACNHSTNVFKIPLCLVIVACYIIYFILLMLSPIVKLNFPYSVASFQQLQISYTFNCDKAADMIRYTPLFDYKECLTRSVSYYKQFAR